jgi:hypothetical protein
MGLHIRHQALCLGGRSFRKIIPSTGIENAPGGINQEAQITGYRPCAHDFFNRSALGPDTGNQEEVLALA